MGKPTAVRLQGADDDIIDLAAQAKDIVAGADRDFSRSFLPAVAGLSRARRAHLEGAPLADPSPADGAIGRAGAGAVLWAVVFGLGVAAASVSAAMMFPPLRRIVLDPALSVPTVLVASIVAIVALAVAAVVRPPARFARPASVFAVIGAGVVGVAVVYRVVVGTSGGSSYTATQLTLWFVAAAVVLVALVVLAVRLRRATSAADAALGISLTPNSEHRQEAARLRAFAAELAGRRPTGAAADEKLAAGWERALAAAQIDAAALAQARELGPVAWLVWAAYDGGHDLSALHLG